jgi:hypothetical protein
VDSTKEKVITEELLKREYEHNGNNFELSVYKEGDFYRGYISLSGSRVFNCEISVETASDMEKVGIKDLPVDTLILIMKDEINTGNISV